jgi:hypothetical protein
MSDYFYIITLTWTVGRDVHQSMRSGLVTGVTNESQQDLYARIHAGTCAAFGIPEDRACVLFYHLVRNES